MTDATFDPIAELYDRFAEVTQHRYQRWIEQVLPERGWRAVDLGCGSGRFMEVLASRYDEILAVDASPRMIDLARYRHPQRSIHYRVGDLWDVNPDRDGTFDLVFSVNTLHHLGPDPQEYLAHVAALVRPGGQIVIIDCVQHTPGWAGTAMTYRLYRYSRTLTGAIRAGVARRSLGDGLAAYRLHRHQQWRRLAAEAPTLSRAEFHEYYTAAFPEAIFTDTLDASVCAVTGRVPAPIVLPRQAGPVDEATTEQRL
jgi:ubiquinone/menaquinone biosynthesis C-methylase UbiE